jgi:hypothetical protein
VWSPFAGEPAGAGQSALPRLPVRGDVARGVERRQRRAAADRVGRLWRA